MRIAIPVVDEMFSPHFGRSTGIYLAEVDLESKQVTQPRMLDRQTKGCESLPQWLRDLAVDMVVAGGIGGAAVQSLRDKGINVSAGHRGQSPQDVVSSFLDSPEGDASNVCNHDEHENHHCRNH